MSKSGKESLTSLCFSLFRLTSTASTRRPYDSCATVSTCLLLTAVPMRVRSEDEDLSTPLSASLSFSKRSHSILDYCMQEQSARRWHQPRCSLMVRSALIHLCAQNLLLGR